MDAILIGLITFVCVFGGAVVGLFLRPKLPDHHLSEDSKSAVRTGTGLLATLAALVLGLLISSAKSSFDSINATVAQSAAKIVLLDRAMAHYGPETKQARDMLRQAVASRIKMIWPESKTAIVGWSTFETAPVVMESVQEKLMKLVPQNDSQKLFQSQALQINDELLQSRWLAIEQAQVPFPTVFLAVLLLWVTLLFASIGLLAPKNTTVVIVLLVCAISVAGAVFLIRELNSPLEGTIKVSNAPLVKALEHLEKASQDTGATQQK
jgi:hypothetical protein